MSAPQENQLSASVQRLGIVAGGGDIPLLLAEACQKQNIEPFVVVLEGQADVADYAEYEHISAKLGAAGSIIKALKDEDISDLVMIGRVRRPSLKELKPDLKTAEFFATEGLKVLGDDGLLRGVRRFLEKEGFTLHGAQSFMPELLMPEGVLGKHKPSKDQTSDIERGVALLKTLGDQDVGQAAVVQNGYILGIEGAEGTDELIKRCGPLQRKGTGAVLVKLCKPAQDQDIDLPTIGLQTIENLIEAGFSGIAAHAGQSFIYDRQGVQDRANQGKLFVVGIDP